MSTVQTTSLSTHGDRKPTTASAVTLTTALPAVTALSRRDQVAEALGIKPAERQRSYSTVRDAYAKFLRVKAALLKYDGMMADGSWPLDFAPKPKEIVEVFYSYSTHGTNKNAFTDVPKYPAMEKWLTATPDAPSDEEIWGNRGSREQTIATCKVLVANFILQNETRKQRKMEKEKDAYEDKGEGSSKGKGKKPGKVVEKARKSSKQAK